MAKTIGKMIANNKKAYHDYFIDETYEAGVALHGTEVKSMRMGKCSIKESFIRIENGEVYVYGMHVSPYEKGNIFNKDPLRVKKLLMHKYEINKLAGKIAEKGYTLVPLQVYFKDGKAKVEVGGTIYDVEPAQYEGTTPLSAQNLNQIQANVESAISELTEEVRQKKIQITELYGNRDIEISHNMEKKINLTDDWTKYDVCIVITRGDYNHYNSIIFIKGYNRAYDIHIGAEQSGYYATGYAVFDTNTAITVKCENAKGKGR